MDKNKSRIEGRLDRFREFFTKHRRHRKIIGVIFFVLAFVIIALEFFSIDIPKGLDLDGVASLVMLTALILLLNIDQEITKTLKTNYKFETYSIVILFFIFVGIIGLWFTLRTFGVLVRQSIFVDLSLTYPDNVFVYTTSQVFMMLGYLLAANLCFSLAKTFREIGTKQGDDDDNDDRRTTPKLLGAVIQAIIIGMITFIPRYSDSMLISVIGNGNNFHGAILYVVILIALVGSLMALIYFRNKVFPNEDDIKVKGTERNN